MTQVGDGGDTMTGGEAIVRSLAANGIDTVFGIPGAQIYPLFDALLRLGLHTVVPRHEQAAAYMAMGAAQSTGRPAAFAVVPGPGILNTTAALCTAAGTCTPVLGVTGQIPSSFAGIGRGHLHELADQRGTLSGIVKSAVSVPSVAATSTVVNAAMRTMVSGRPGPVTIEMAWDTMASAGPALIESPLACAGAGEVDLDAIAAAAAMIKAARQPLLMVGGGARHAFAEVRALAEKLQVPVTAFRSGRGVLAADHPLWLDPVAARLLWDSVDLVIGIGTRLEMLSMRWRDMMTYEPRLSGGRTLIRIDVDGDEMHRLVPDVAVVADSAAGAAALERSVIGPAGGAGADRLDDLRRTARSRYVKVQPQVDYLDVIRDVLPRDGFFVPELSQMGFTSYFAFPVYEPRTYVTEGYQGTLGFGFPTALGVKIANPDRAVVSVSGDGGFMFGVQELATAAQYGIGLVTIVFDNGGYGNVRRDQQERFGGRLIGADFPNPDFVALARSFGLTSQRVASPMELRAALAVALDADEPAVLVVKDGTTEVSPWEFIHMATVPK
jgi:acetolactate synthase I/II/III large subunit